MVPDTESLSPVPWLERTGRVVCDTMWYDGRPQMANPYLVAASTIAAGLLGVMQKRELSPAAAGPKEDDARFEKLPTAIEDAPEAFEADVALRDLLGEQFVKVYLAMKWQEANRLRDEIPAAETNEDFELH